MGKLEAGSTLRVTFTSHYPVREFGGRKHLMISTTSWIGGKNSGFLGVGYLTVGIACFLSGVGFLAQQKLRPRELGEVNHLDWIGFENPYLFEQPKTGSSEDSGGEG